MRGPLFRRFAGAVLGVLLAAVAVLALAPRTARAYGLIDTTRKGSLTVVYQDDGVGITGAEVELRHVASVSATVRLELDADYEGYGVSLDIEDSAGWRAAAQTLAGYVERDGLAADAVATTGPDGRATFADLEPGLYLVTSSSVTQGGIRYEQEPALVMVPQLDDDDSWVYDAIVELKHEDTPLPPPVTHTSVSVVKLWLGDDPSERPESITAQLLRDGALYDSQVLSAANGWSYTWTDLDASYTWTVVEASVPEGYTGSVHREGDTFIIENEAVGSDDPDGPDPDNPDEPDPGDPDEPDGPDEPDEPDGPDEPDEPDGPDEPDDPDIPGDPDKPGDPDEPGDPDRPNEEDVPNTGMARSLVGPLAAAGVLLYAIGWWLGGKADKDGRL